MWYARSLPWKAGTVVVRESSGPEPGFTKAVRYVSVGAGPNPVQFTWPTSDVHCMPEPCAAATTSLT